MVLATATASAPGETLQIQTIAISVDGAYTVEISGDGATDYDLSLFRNATVEVVDSEDGAEQDATGSFIPLGSGRFGIVGSFDGSGEVVPPSQTVVFDFEEFTPPTPQLVSSVTATRGGIDITIAREDGVLFDIDRVNNAVFNSQFGFNALSPFDGQQGASLDSRFVVDFSVPISSVSVDMGDFGADGDLLQLLAYSGPGGTGQLLGQATSSLPPGGNTFGFDTLTVSANAIESIIMVGGIGSFPNSVYYDNISVTTVGNGPAPAGGQTNVVFGASASDSGIVNVEAGEFSDAVITNPTPADNANPYGDPGEPGRFPTGPTAVAQPVAPNELLVNGSFETGDFSGWTSNATGTPFRPWDVTGAGQGGGFGFLQTQPQDGSFVAWNGFDGSGPMEFQLYQDVTIAAGATATLSWMDRIQWRFFAPNPQPRDFGVEIRDPVTNAVLQTVFSFTTGTTTGVAENNGWQSRSVDVSAFAGQTVRVFFREQMPQSNTGPGQVEIDAVSLTVDGVGSVETMYGGVGRGSVVNPGGVLIVDQNTGAGTLLADPITPGGLTGLDFDSSDRLWGSSIDGPGGNRVSDLVEIDPDTGALISSVPITRSGVPVSIGDLAVQPGTDAIYAIHSNADASPFPGGEIYTIDRTSGVATLVGTTGSGTGGGLAFAPDGTLYYVQFGLLHTLDPTNASILTTTSLDFAGQDGLGIRPSDGTLFAPNARGTNSNEGIRIIDPIAGTSTEIGTTGVGNASDLAFRVTGEETGPDVDEYLLDLTGKAGQPIDIALSSDIVVIGGSAILELLDTDGTTVLATGKAVSDNFDLGILDFVVPADGVYTVRATSTGQGDYAIVVTDPLVFDTEPNRPNDSPLRSLDAYEGALGYLDDGTIGGGDVDLSLLNSFESLDSNDSGFIPPDPIIAAGPASVVTMVNTDIAIHDKTSGAVIAQSDLDGGGGFWASNNTVFDPWITYDPDSGRFFAMGIDRVQSGFGSSRVYLAVSTDSTPNNLTTDWNKYIIDRTGTHTGTGGPTFPDYPKLGVNEDAIFISANDFGISGGGFSHASLFAIEKAPLLVGGAANIVYDEVITNAFSIFPVTVYDPGAPMYFAQSNTGSGNTITLHALTNVLTSGVRTTSTVSVPSFAAPPDVPQQGGPALDAIDARIMSGVVRDGSLWTAHSIQDLSVDTETIVRWYEFDISGFPSGSASLVQEGNVDPGPGVHSWMAHVNVDNDGDMGIAFSVSGANQFAGIGYTGRLASDPLGTTRPVQIARAGEGSYSRFDSIGRNRWGDYSGLAIDPDGESFWLYNEYAAAGNNWGTFVGQFQVEPGNSTSQDVDTYEITLAAGETIGLNTITPFDDPIDSLNLLDPSLQILDPSGVSVAFDSGSAADGKNVAPTLVLDPVAMINENESATLTGTITDPGLLDEHDVVIDWDDPNASADATFALPSTAALTVGDTYSSTTDSAVLTVTAIDLSIGRVSFSVDHVYADDGSAPGNGTPSDVQTIVANVNDDDAGVDDETGSVLVKNVAPTVNAVSISATEDNKAMPGDDVALTATFTDIGLLDRHDVVVAWDDGTPDSVFDVDAATDLTAGDSFTSTSGDGAVLTISSVNTTSGQVAFSVTSHQFSTGGIFDVIVTITDDDTGADDALTQSWVSGVRITDGVLQVIGTSIDDQVTINQEGDGTLKVHADFLQTGNFETFVTSEVDKIIAYLCEGNDHFTIAGNVDIPAIVHGGGGDDHLNGGRGPVVLLGDDGNDTLIGGSGRDILIGGLHNDRIVGAQNEDLLIGGTTAFDDDDEALMTLLAEWNSDASYSDRASAVDALLTVIDDETEDKRTGSSGQDLFYDGLGDVLTDVKTNKVAETVL